MGGVGWATGQEPRRWELWESRSLTQKIWRRFLQGNPVPWRERRRARPLVKGWRSRDLWRPRGKGLSEEIRKVPCSSGWGWGLGGALAFAHAIPSSWNAVWVHSYSFLAITERFTIAETRLRALLALCVFPRSTFHSSHFTFSLCAYWKNSGLLPWSSAPWR